SGRSMCPPPLDGLATLYVSTAGTMPPAVKAVTAFSPGTSATAPRGGKTAARPPLAGEAAPYAAYGRPFTARKRPGGPPAPDNRARQLCRGARRRGKQTNRTTGRVERRPSRGT